MDSNADLVSEYKRRVFRANTRRFASVSRNELERDYPLTSARETSRELRVKTVGDIWLLRDTVRDQPFVSATVVGLPCPFAVKIVLLADIRGPPADGELFEITPSLKPISAGDVRDNDSNSYGRI